jgi:arylsulfatase A-like enzyme
MSKEDINRTVLPIPDHDFRGVRNRTLAGSTPDWGIIEPVKPPEGAPNILLILIDDAGFGNPSTFGGPINTPNLTRMAEEGLRYNRFHVTALCSPTRAAMLTGRNHHAVGFGSIGELPGGWPGYSAVCPKTAAPFPQILQMNGYSTAAFGKWHMTPDHQQGPAGPFDRWPNAWGFDYFWGFLGGESGQYDPLLAENNTVIGVPEEKGFYLPDAMPAWDSIPDDIKKLYARQMEVYAGYQENADYNVGRVIDAIAEMGELDNTLVIYIWGDNGASMEGTLTGSFNGTFLLTMHGIPLTNEQQLALIEKYGGLEAWGTEIMAPHYAAAWAWAGNCPFQWGKQVASYLGGTRNPMVVSWPKCIEDKGGLRAQFTHCIDIGPTILEIVGLSVPTEVNGVKQDPMHGTSFLYTFDDEKAAEQHTQQYFEICGNRAMYKDGWWAAAMLSRIPWDVTPAVIRKFAPGVWNPDEDLWELYYLPDDFSQADDLAAKYPDKLKELQELFWEEAEKHKVTPLLAGFSFLLGITPPLGMRTTFTYFGEVQNVASGMIPRIYNHSYTRSADLVIPSGGVEGVIVAEADHLGGFSLYVENSVLKHTYSMMGVFAYTQQATEPLPTGDVRVRMEFAADAPKPATGGNVSLFVNNKKVGGGQMDHTMPFRFSGYAGMDIGRDNGLPVSRSYAAKSPFKFTGKVKKVVFDVSPHPNSEDEQALYEIAHHGPVAHGIDM